MLRTRIITAVVLLLLLAAAALLSPLALQALAVILVGACLGEWLKLTGLAPAASWTLATLAGGVFYLGATWPALRDWSVWPWTWGLGSLVWIWLTGWLVRLQRGAADALPAFWLQVLALGLSANAWFALVCLLNTGLLWSVSVLAMVWIADIAAYGFGRWLGRAKLADRISPGKTQAGAWGALATVLLLCHGLAHVAPGLPLWSTALLAQRPLSGSIILAAIVVLSIAGDLFESAIKRHAGVKDSGRLLPGHGGAWDRLDASIPVLPLAALGQWYFALGTSHAG